MRSDWPSAIADDEPLPDALADVARALGAALAAQFRADMAREPKEMGIADVRNAEPRAGFHQHE